MLVCTRANYESQACRPTVYDCLIVTFSFRRGESVVESFSARENDEGQPECKRAKIQARLLECSTISQIKDFETRPMVSKKKRRRRGKTTQNLSAHPSTVLCAEQKRKNLELVQRRGNPNKRSKYVERSLCAFPTCAGPSCTLASTIGLCQRASMINPDWRTHASGLECRISW